jgi:DNA-binding SARP family transcriptional activator
MEFRILGPVEVILGGDPVGINAPRQEIVLTTLLLEANRVVPVNRLVDALWDEDPPATAKGQVQIAMSALRRLLAVSGDGGVIVTRSPGYVIRVPDDALDLKGFESLAADGSAAAAEDRLEEAVQKLRGALALWRGPVAEGVESKVVQAAAVRLNESRLGLWEECIDLELRLGRHHALIGALSELVAKYPLRERLRAQLMLALYRSGRQAEALDAFRNARAVLNEELGLEPGEELQGLERACGLAGPRPCALPMTGAGRCWDAPAWRSSPPPWRIPAPAGSTSTCGACRPGCGWRCSTCCSAAATRRRRGSSPPGCSGSRGTSPPRT